jgi:hypothetical protein
MDISAIEIPGELCYIQEKIDLEDGCSTRMGSSQRKRARGE